MPLLKDLRVMHIYSTDRHINIPEEKLRRLRHLKLTGRVYFEPGVLSGLETLHLEGLADAACPSVSQLITVLRGSPTLIQLTLQNVKPAGLVPSNSPLIKLGRLIDLDLTNLPLQLTHDIISIARIPRCRRLTVVVENETPSGKVLDTQTAHLKPVIRSILRRVESSFVELKSGSFGLSTPRSGDDSFSLRLALPSASFMNLRSWLNDTLDSTSPTHSIDLTISTPLNARSQVTGAPFLNKMDQVTSLNLDPGTAHCGAWMDYLSAPFLQSNNTLQWPLPNLNRLIISNPLLSPDRLVQMLRNRYGRSKVKQEGWPEKRPARLEMISLLSMHTIRKEDVDIIEEIVKGSVDMDWDEHVERMEHHKHHKYNLEVDEAYQF
ncbi:hypothetical protein FRB97_000291 [Tulasnella sp. 331]|nr:hypothetical protein FRB97_000291 [Tulasnella sp. 331]